MMINYPTPIKISHTKRAQLLPRYSEASPQRIMILGSSGSGKSTLARQLGQKLSLPVIHLDKHYWHPGWVPTSDEVWKKQIQTLAQEKCWIMDGNYRATLPARMAHADMIIFLDLPRWLCAFRAIKRRIQFANRPRPDMAKGCHESLFDPSFLSFLGWIWDYPNRARPEIMEHLFALAAEKQIVWLQSPREVRQLLANPSVVL